MNSIFSTQKMKVINKLKGLTPFRMWESLKIQTRLLSAVVLLGIVMIAAPLYIRFQLNSLAEIYELNLSRRSFLNLLHDYKTILSDSESRIRAFTVSGRIDWIEGLNVNFSQIEKIHENLSRLKLKIVDSRAADDSQVRLNLLLNETWESFESWKKQILNQVINFEAKSTNQKYLDNFSKRMTLEPVSYRIQTLLGELQKNLHEDEKEFSDSIAQANRLVTQKIMYGGIIFFFLYALLMGSLWHTLIPGLRALLSAAKEFKSGHLEHRISLAGRSETAQIARAFNEMAVSIRAQNEKLKELSRIKSDFVSTVSHELRTPLTAIRGSIGLILGKVTGDISAETAQMLEITQKNTDRLIRLINEILDVAKIEAGAIQMSFEKTSLLQIIEHAIAAIEPFAQTQAIRIELLKSVVLPIVVIDRDRIEQVMTNLLSNAIKFSEPGGVIEVSFEATQDKVIVHVKDNGIGISDEFIDRIFDKFHRAEDSVNKAKEGTGLGLTIVRAIVEEHGGKIRVESSVGVGSRFTFELPWNGQDRENVLSLDESDSYRLRSGFSAIHKQKIFIVDDEQDFTTVVKKFLAHDGYEVIVSNVTSDVVSRSIQEKPDLIILDVMMPEMSGLILGELLRSNSETKSIPIVFMTISPDIARLDGETVISKPIDYSEFRNWLHAFFHQKDNQAKAS